jgi:hypothetical protein
MAEEGIAKLTPGDRLFWMLDGENDYNPNAIALRTKERYLIGYLPDYLVTDIAHLVKARMFLHVTIERINLPPVPRHYRLLCRVEAGWPDGFAPLSGSSFQPLTASPIAR